MRAYLAIVVLFFLFIDGLCAQSKFASFLTPADSLVNSRRNLVVVSEVVLTSAALVGLHELWYADYEKSSFHFTNDNADWLQMDKVGHVFSSYHLGRFSSEMLAWSGVSKKNQLLYGAGYGFVFLTAVEILDGHSAEWGFSWGDVGANAAGTALYVSQELLWHEQRIVPKFSFHTTQFASQRPEVLGSSFSEQLLKDYNGQTYWLSANLHSFLPATKVPRWLNVAFGYGAEGMILANLDSSSDLLLPNYERYRQFYLSLDVDLTKIDTRSTFLRTLFSVFNTIKIPAPTFEIRGSRGVKFHWIYF
ncbi:DUF2279 domain-containing protein [Flavobacterium orientale]|uniref:DUF2279 domain-containing protein n=1 Tax=Flavobacterium orientale TaxID=1756020 RepID=A0A916Y4Z0_9FLAO|nr:DUF2279 domain-containing protein [Flavobacterium orientale]GGD29995.1 DUF2279 domain-containing protein [Flavobacterium orientale]